MMLWNCGLHNFLAFSSLCSCLFVFLVTLEFMSMCVVQTRDNSAKCSIKFLLAQPWSQLLFLILQAGHKLFYIHSSLNHNMVGR